MKSETPSWLRSIEDAQKQTYARVRQVLEGWAPELTPEEYKILQRDGELILKPLTPAVVFQATYQPEDSSFKLSASLTVNDFGEQFKAPRHGVHFTEIVYYRIPYQITGLVTVSYEKNGENVVGPSPLSHWDVFYPKIANPFDYYQGHYQGESEEPREPKHPVIGFLRPLDASPR